MSTVRDSAPEVSTSCGASWVKSRSPARTRARIESGLPPGMRTSPGRTSTVIACGNNRSLAVSSARVSDGYPNVMAIARTDRPAAPIAAERHERHWRHEVGGRDPLETAGCRRDDQRGKSRMPLAGRRRVNRADDGIVERTRRPAGGWRSLRRIGRHADRSGVVRYGSPPSRRLSRRAQQH